MSTLMIPWNGLLTEGPRFCGADLRRPIGIEVRRSHTQGDPGNEVRHPKSFVRPCLSGSGRAGRVGLMATRPEGGCCSPSRGYIGAASPPTDVPPAGSSRRAQGMVPLLAGAFVTGSGAPFASPDDGEAPREFELSSFMIDPHAVSNAAFAEFVAAIG